MLPKAQPPKTQYARGAPALAGVFRPATHFFTKNRGPARETAPKLTIRLRTRCFCSLAVLILSKKPYHPAHRRYFGISPALSGRAACIVTAPKLTVRRRTAAHTAPKLMICAQDTPVFTLRQPWSCSNSGIIRYFLRVFFLFGRMTLRTGLIY